MSRKRSLPAAETLIWPITSAIEPIDLKKLFALQKPMELELGCGDGSFTLQYAMENPALNIVALERLLGRITKINRKAHRAELKNLRLLRAEARYVLEYLLSPDSFEAVHVYFPDPWPKKRHHKNRLIGGLFPAIVKRLLRKDGVIYLRTDNIEYFEQMLEVFGAAKGFDSIETPESVKKIITDFERDFNSKGIPTRYAAYRSI
ncbi:MAG: tRNA (guanosine(46)-N7)-methyltransferase TrmB [Verrucomicrobiota bacterium]|jgi:tRNA (guanine-N7-)-methyltransferase|nr:tRNA (guanosine(46)-N7)-methyltransferase TrmB [Verrucomicrobiota bacterium]